MKSRILIVDDHDDFRKVVKEHLEKNHLDLEIYEASSAEMAIVKAACVNPDIVLLDIRLPGVNGFVGLKEIKRDHPDCDVIILSMFEVESFRKMTQESAATDFVGKSEVFEQLIPAIKRCLKNHNGKKRKERDPK